MVISLCGFMGCGKSSVGRILSERLACRFVDLDELIERRAGRTIAEIFGTEGEAGFRMMERDALEDVLSGQTGTGIKPEANALLLLSLGGGTVTTPECAAMVREKTFCIYLRAGIGTLLRNLRQDSGSRPMLHQDSTGASSLDDRIRELIQARKSIYEDCAGMTVDMDGLTPGQAADIIIAGIRHHGL